MKVKFPDTRAVLAVGDPTLNYLQFAADLLSFAGDQLRFGPAAPVGVLAGGRPYEPVVVMCDTDGRPL